MSTHQTNFPKLDNQDDVRSLQKFTDFIRIKSVSSEGPKGSYKEAVEFLAQYSKEVGLNSSKVFELVPGKPILFVSYLGSQPELPAILLNSHYDVVPADKPKWNCDPFGGYISQDGNIFGRGTQDMKCVCIQYIEAVGRIKAKVAQGKIPHPPRTILLSFLPDEEVGGGDGAAKLVSAEEFKRLNLGLVLDEGLANPLNAYTFFYGERAPWWVKISATGPAGHGSRFIPRSAIEKLSDVISQVYKYRAIQEKKNYTAIIPVMGALMQ